MQLGSWERGLRGGLGSDWGFSKHFVWVSWASCSEVLGPSSIHQSRAWSLPRQIKGSGGVVYNLEAAAQAADGNGCLSDRFFFLVCFGVFCFLNHVAFFLPHSEFFLNSSKNMGFTATEVAECF